LEALDNLASFKEVTYINRFKFQLKGDVKNYIKENVKIKQNSSKFPNTLKYCQFIVDLEEFL